MQLLKCVRFQVKDDLIHKGQASLFHKRGALLYPIHSWEYQGLRHLLQWLMFLSQRDQTAQ